LKLSDFPSSSLEHNKEDSDSYVDKKMKKEEEYEEEEKKQEALENFLHFQSSLHEIRRPLSQEKLQ